MSFLQVANSPLMFILCFIFIELVCIQSVLFLRTAWKRGKELGIEKEVMKKTITNSALFSVIPSLAIIVSLMVLSVPLGQYFPWLRLSVVGSATYETMAAGQVATGSGLTGLSDPNMSLSIFTTAMWVMTVGIIWGIVFNVFFMRSLDRFSKKAKASGNTFVPIFSSALFLGMLAMMSIPHVSNIQKPIGIVSFLAAAVCAVLCNKVAIVTKVRTISEFSLPISLIVGMGAAILYTQMTL